MHGDTGASAPHPSKGGRAAIKRSIWAGALAAAVALSASGCAATHPPAKTLERAAPMAGIDAAEFKALLQQVADAWNANDAKGAASAFADDAIYTEPPAKQVYRGREALYRFFGGDSGRTSWMRMTWRHISFDAESQVGAGEFTFAWPGGQAHGMASIRIRDGKIANWREYFYESPLIWEEFQGVNQF